MYEKIQRIIGVTLKLGTLPGLLLKSESCFELLAADFILDKKLNPYLIGFKLDPDLTLETEEQKERHTRLVNNVSFENGDNF